MANDKTHKSIAGVRLDLVTAKILVWVVTVGRVAELTSDARARSLQAKADEHYRLGGGEGPPFAAAMGMPRPRQWLATDAVSRRHLKGPDDAA